MLQKITSYLLITAVIICPYVCLEDAVATTSAACETDCCSCARHNPPPVEPTPQSPDDSDHDCFCQGAIMDSARVVELDYLTMLTGNWLLGSIQVLSHGPSLADLSFEPPHQFPPFCTGREVCALTCRLLL
jgi:hypothetical protein